MINPLAPGNNGNPVQYGGSDKAINPQPPSSGTSGTTSGGTSGLSKVKTNTTQTPANYNPATGQPYITGTASGGYTATNDNGVSTNVSPTGTATPATNTPPIYSPDGSLTDYGRSQQSTPQVGTAAQNAQNVLNQSDLSNNPEYQQGTQNALLINAAQQNAQNAGKAGSQNNLSQAATTALGTPYSNIFLPQSTGNLQGELGILSPQLSQAGTFATGEQNAALSAGQLATQGANSVLNASIPGQISGSARTYNPLDPQGTSGTNGIIAGANNQSIYNSQQQYATGQQNLTAADGIQNQIVNTLQNNPSLNSNPLSILTNLNEYVSGETGSAAQQQLAQQINNYVQTLGIDPSSLVSLQTQQQGTLAQLLDSLRATAQAKNDALNPANNPVLNGGSTGTTSSTPSTGSTGGDLYSF